MPVGPYRLVRPHRSTHLRIYHIRSAATDELLATLWRVAAADLGIPEEWNVRCSLCPARKTYPSRDRALTWLGYHRLTKHPHSVEKESA